MTRVFTLATVLALGVSAGHMAEASSEKQEYCGHQGDIVAALRQAKLDRVPERQAQAHVIASATWPAKYNAAVPIYVGEIYKINRRDLKTTDLGAQWTQTCMDN